MKIDPEHWRAVSSLLDEALDLPSAEARGEWLRDLQARSHPCHATLAELLNAHALAQTEDFLDTPAWAVRLPGLETEPPPGDDAGRTVGGYRLVRELGRGGMGSVWLAERLDGLLKRPVALKLPHPGLAARGLAQRLARERDILAALTHPHIARLYDAGIAGDGQPFIALEYVEGDTIVTACDTRRLGVRARVQLFLQVLDAVQYAHAHLIIHRDLKPSNVLVDATGQVKLLDFGVAKLLVDGQGGATELTLDAGQALTPDYASPEQIMGQALSTASDVYSLGVLLYQLLTGVRPYQLLRQGEASLAQSILSVDMPRPSAAVANQPQSAQARNTTSKELARTLRGDLDTILLKALKRKPEQRFETAEALRGDLQRYLEGRPVHARPDSRPYVLRKFVARNRLAVAGAAAVVGILVTAAAVSYTQAETARKESERARRETERGNLINQFALDSFARVAADNRIANDASREAMRDALNVELKRVEQANSNSPAALAAVYARASLMFHYLERPAEGVDAALKELHYLELAGESAGRIAEAHRQLALALYRRDDDAQAVEHAQAGIRLLAAPSNTGEQILRARLWRLLGNMLEAQGKLDAAQTAHEAAVAGLEPIAQAAEHYLGSALIALARVEHSRGDDLEPQTILSRVRRMYAAMPTLMESEWGDLEWTAGFIASGLGHYAEAETAYRKAASLYGKQFGTGSANAAGIDVLIAVAVMKQGDYAQATRLLERAVPILVSTDFAGASLGSRALIALANLHVDSGDLLRAPDSQQRLATLSRMPPSARVGAAVSRARFEAELGRLDEARAALAEATQLAAASMPGAVRLRRSIALAAAWVEHVGGNPGEARTRLAAAGIAMPDAQGIDFTLLAARDCAAAIDLDEGDAQAALAYFESAAGRLEDLGANVRGARDEAIARIAFGRALLAARRTADARRQFDRAVGLLASQHPLSPLRALARNWQGIAAAEVGMARDAQAALAEVRSVHAKLPALNDEYRAAEGRLAGLLDAARHRSSAVARGG